MLKFEESRYGADMDEKEGEEVLFIAVLEKVIDSRMVVCTR